MLNKFKCWLLFPTIVTIVSTIRPSNFPTAPVVLSDKSLFGLSPSIRLDPIEEDVVGSGISLETPKGDRLERMKHVINGIEVWNSGGVKKTTRFGSRSIQHSVVVQNLVDGTAKERFRTLLEHSVTPLQYYSVEQCHRQLAHILNGIDTVNSTTRFLYDRKDNGGIVFADLVTIQGKHKFFIYFCLYDTKYKKIIDHWSGIYYADGIFYGGNRKTGLNIYDGHSKPLLPMRKSPPNMCQVRQYLFFYLFSFFLHLSFFLDNYT